jgi:hypothetical protein
VGAEHATAEKVNAPQELALQEAPAEEQATTEEGRILQLQRQFGNRAVTALLRGDVSPAVQRAIPLTASQFSGRTLKERLHTTFAGADTYGKIANVLADFQASRSDDDRLELADALIGLTEHWLDKLRADPKRSSSKTQQGRRNNVAWLGKEARREARELRRKKGPPGQKDYLDKLDAGGFQGVDRGRTKVSVTDPAEDLAAGKETRDTKGADARALALVRKFRLTADEIAAIRIFTAPDYTYINPGLANSPSWLQDNLAKAKDPHIKDLVKRKVDPATLLQEGAEHGAKALNAIRRLPEYTQIAYRGERMSIAKFKKNYKDSSIMYFGGFGSAAKKREVAQNYAVGRKTDLDINDDDVVSVLALVFPKTKARDISLLSASPKDEEEIVILPNTTYIIERWFPVPPPADRGEPPTAHWYMAYLREK